ncbi:MAG: DUF192 domain-containing protein [Pseudobdellovibrio sp.]
MAKLYKTSTPHDVKNCNSGAELLIDNLEIAESLVKRGTGLLGRSSLEVNQALWIKPCNNIHTFFMKFAIDCIFIDRKLEIKKIAKSVKPFRFIGPYWRAYSVIEAKAGFAEEKKLQIGDQLYVVS